MSPPTDPPRIPLDWNTNDSSRRTLRESLARLDPRTRLVDTLCEDAGLDLARVDFNGPSRVVWASVITVARQMQRLPELAAAALVLWPEDGVLQQLAAASPALPAPTSTPAPVRAFAMGAGVVADAMAERARDPLEKVLSELQIADAAQWLLDYQSMMGRVALVQTGESGSGTGFLIGPDLLLTNWHVVACVADHRVAPSKVQVRFDYWRPPGGLADGFTQVGLAADWLVDHAPWSACDITAGSTTLPRADELDFAVLRLAQPVGASPRGASPRGWIGLPSTSPITAGQSLLILQHPSGHPLRLAFDAVLSVNANQTRVRYRTNTLPGSSGAPCFDQNWRLLALHHAGDPRLAPVYNEGIPATAIRALLVERGKVTLPDPR